jgi:hypothetical protein
MASLRAAEYFLPTRMVHAANEIVSWRHGRMVVRKSCARSDIRAVRQLVPPVASLDRSKGGEVAVGVTRGQQRT